MRRSRNEIQTIENEQSLRSNKKKARTYSFYNKRNYQNTSKYQIYVKKDLYAEYLRLTMWWQGLEESLWLTLFVAMKIPGSLLTLSFFYGLFSK